MKKKMIISMLLICFLLVGLFHPISYAADVTDDNVQAVIEQLEAIDTLETIQQNRDKYVVGQRYNVDTTNSTIINAHETARTEYETYVSQMFAARIAAQQAYDSLSDAQKNQIDSSLVEKLNNDLPTVFHSDTFSVTPSDNEYTFETTGNSYEVSHHMVSGNIAQTFILVDTSDGKTSWTPSGKYVSGDSNYEVTYCCDVETKLEHNFDYKRLNLEDSSYYGTESAKHIRAILQNSYPYLTMDEMKANLKAGGLNAEFVDKLTRSDIIAAVQMAIWSYANIDGDAKDGLGYFASIDITHNIGTYFSPLHDTNNECWDWRPGYTLTSYDARAAYRVNNLAYYLANLPGAEAGKDEIVISDIKVARADLKEKSSGIYNVGMYVYLNNGGSTNDNLKITVTSYAEDGSITGRTAGFVNEDTQYQFNVRAKYGDTIKVSVEGTQHLGKGVYFYEPEGGRKTSQCLVGMSSGATKIKAEKEFIFHKDIDMGLRIYKTATETGHPISDIEFDIYQAEPAEGETLGEFPTLEEIEKYAVESNKVGTIITDETGYGFIRLNKGTHLVIERHNEEKVKAPVDPYYVTIPMAVTEIVPGEGSDTETSVIYKDIASVYPKNEPVTPPEEPPVIPPPDDVTGSFTILKHDKDDKSVVLEGAKFQVYLPTTEADENTETITYNGIKYAVVPVMVDGKKLLLTTGEDGIATSPELPCGTYFLVETKSPSGYNALDEAVSVTVKSTLVENLEITYIANERGSILPETGGMGTTLFYAAGAILLIGAAILLITKKRMNNYN